MYKRGKKMKIIICTVLLFLAISSAAFEITGDTHAWKMEDFIGFDEVGDCTAKIGDITSAYAKTEEKKLFIRITFDDMCRRKNNVSHDNFMNSNIKLLLEITDNNKQQPNIVSITNIIPVIINNIHPVAAIIPDITNNIHPITAIIPAIINKQPTRINRSKVKI